ncbi:MAG TPA: hemerythrin family protein [Gallionella sp.]|nr:hemerythrin family protein [Gallionella sp.]
MTHPATAPHPNPLPPAGEGANESLRDKKPIFDEGRHALGVAEMDDTHREFISQVAALIAASPAEFPALFQTLVNHTRAHFTAEGLLMRASRYKGLPEHESEHHRVLGELLQLNRSLKRGHLPLVRAYVKEGLMDWFDTHVAMMDAALAMHLKKSLPPLS